MPNVRTRAENRLVSRQDDTTETVETVETGETIETIETTETGETIETAETAETIGGGDGVGPGAAPRGVPGEFALFGS